MIPTLTFFGITALLLFQGSTIASILLPRGGKVLALALALPLAAFTNVLLVFLYTIAHIGLTPFTIIGGHVLITLIVGGLCFQKPQLQMKCEALPKEKLHTWDKVFISISALILAMNVIYSFSHAILLPTMQYDSATNWTMRSKISYVDQAIAFDKTEDRGMAKPQYPFLFHSLQITANQGQREWNDTAANAILYFLSLGTFIALYLLLRVKLGIAQSALTIATVIGIPLFGLHIAQGYGDLNVAQYFLLSLVCLGLWISERSALRWLLLSGIFVAASVWTKAEGSVVGFAPWLVCVAVVCGRKVSEWKRVAPTVAAAIALAIPWPIFAWASGLSLTPHSSDTTLLFEMVAVMEAMRGLFSRGSFGITWYVIPALLVLVGIGTWKKDTLIRRSMLPLILWAALMFGEFLFIYLFTPNVKFLMNAESYYRQMMIPAAMFLVAISMCIDKKRVESK